MLVKYVIDGNNVAFWQRNIPTSVPSLRPIFRIVNTIVANGDDFYCVFDASIDNILRENGGESEIQILDELLSVYREKFYRVTASTRADSAICEFADQTQCKIITNDLYRDYRGKYKWLEDRYTDRLIQGNMQPNGIMTVEKLPYIRIANDRNLQELFDQFKSSATKPPRHNKADELYLSDGDLNLELRHVQETRKELQLFLQQYGSHVNFDGFIWDSAMTGFKKFFDNTKICTNCWSIYPIESKFDKYVDNGVCRNCGKGAITTRPAKLAEIVNRHVPPGKPRFSYDIPDGAVEAGIIMETQNAMRRFLSEQNLSYEFDKTAATYGVEQIGVPFYGYSWDEATRSFLNFFTRNVVCLKCWKLASIQNDYDKFNAFVSIKRNDFVAIIDDNVKCPHCGDSSATLRPRALIEIINKYRPIGREKISFVEYDKSRARWYVGRMLAVGAAKAAGGAAKLTWEIIRIFGK
ncbi:hypothetical protein CCS01_02610 [Rhodopila globiformis]|uniref:RNase NYN domain-containing protein n=2 Tax=Rhodopila globiformis TaxID=1071 RepID=A0A2S6NNE4_RHOGL|nr:hypothetical protein CCS01_02610 [Rhodopila globiformis]